MTGLIDSTEMYLRTLYELREEGIRPLRARIVDRLHISAPAVSEATARLAQSGLVEVGQDRMVHLTDLGLARATQVMRKHRLAELLLSEVIGLDWRLVHVEACRWEHVISDDVEQRLTVILGQPQRCPHGNAIPPAGAAAGMSLDPEPLLAPPVSLLAAARDGAAEVTLGWLSESLQTDDEAMTRLHDAALLPGARLQLSTARAGGCVVRLADPGAAASGAVTLTDQVAALIYVQPA